MREENGHLAHSSKWTTFHPFLDAWSSVKSLLVTSVKSLFTLFSGGHQMSSGHGKALQRAGLLNVQAHEFGELASGRDRDLRATWCAASCSIGRVDGLQIVHVGGEYRNRCPNCGSTNTFHDRVTPIRAPKLREKAKHFMAKEAKRKGKR